MKSDREQWTDSGFETASEHVPKRLRKAKGLTYKHAQKTAMKYGDADTYFMRKTARKKRATKR